MSLNNNKTENSYYRPGCFVVGTGRCGSTLVSNILQRHSDVLSLSEFFFSQGGRRALFAGELNGVQFLEWLFTFRDPLSKEALKSSLKTPELLDASQFGLSALETRPMLSIVLPHLKVEPGPMIALIEKEYSKRGLAPVSAHYEHLFCFMSNHLQRRIWVERSGGSLDMIDMLLESYPQAKFILMYRSGRACALSMAGHPYFQLLLASITSGGTGKAHETAQRSIPLDRYGTYWSVQIAKGCKALRALPRSSLLLLSYEDLIAQPHKVIRSMLRFIGLNVDDAMLRQMSEEVQDRKRDAVECLGEDELGEIDRSCSLGERALNKLIRSCAT